MIGVYKIREDKISDMKNATSYMLIKGFAVALVIITVLMLIRNEEGTALVLGVFLGAMTLILLVGLLIRYFSYDPIHNSEIEITEYGLIRTGTDLLTIRLKYEDIGKVIPKDNGTVLLKKGIASNLQYYLNNKRPYIAEFDVLFIPLAIEDYDRILAYIKQRIKEELEIRKIKVKTNILW